MSILMTTSKTYDLTKRTHIMGILNVTPDSFSDGGSYTSVDKAVEQAIAMEKEGADIIDIGGESTRPDHQPISLEEELERVIPVIKAVKEKVTIPISVDTYKAEVAEQAIKAGAEMINDIWGSKRKNKTAQVAAQYNVPIVLMHNRHDMNYHSFIEDLKKDLSESIEIALHEGVSEENIIIDPGIGFAKTSEHNLIVMNHLDRLLPLGYPILLGASRKTFIGDILNVPPEERDYGTGATTCLGIYKGASIIRVHHVRITKHLAQMTDTILKGAYNHG